MRRFKGWALLALVCLVGVGCLGGGAGTAHAADCAPPPISFVFLPTGPTGTSAFKLCGVRDLESDAYELYAGVRHLPLNDPRIAEEGQNEIAGIMWQLLQQITQNVESGVPVASYQRGAYQWLKDLVYDYRRGAAQRAIDEYRKWESAPCTYEPPSTEEFTYRGAETLYCRPGQLGALFHGPTPPQLDEFIAYGLYAERQTLHLDRLADEGKYRLVRRQGIAAWQAIWADLTLSATPSVLLKLEGLPKHFYDFARFVAPEQVKSIKLAVDRGAKAALKQLSEAIKLVRQSALRQAGRTVPEVTELAAQRAAINAAKAGLKLARVARLGASSASFVLGVALFSIDVFVEELTEIVRQQELLPKLQANLASIKPDLKPLLTNGEGGGNALVLEIFESQLQLADPVDGTAGHVIDTFPDDGTRLRVAHEWPTGGVAYTEVVPTTEILAWPLGPDQGTLGLPKYKVGVSNGQIWHTPDPDEEDAGLRGYLPSGELHYFSWSGQPRVAILVGDKFLDMPGPGSIDMDGRDVFRTCQLETDCQLTNVLFALKHARSVAPSYTLRNPLDAAEDGGVFFPSNGTVKDDLWKVRISIARNTGTPPGQSIVNAWGNEANTLRGGLPNGGLIAGERVSMTAPNSHPFGYDTRYLWHIETRCAYDPAHPPQVIEGVPTCYGDPDYGHTTLGEQDRDLLVGCPDACAPDPAFHGHPVLTVTGQSVPFTWPAPGTYHVRLITRDSFGVTRQSDQDKTIVGDVPGTSPMVPLTVSPGWASQNIIGPVPNGSAVTITGCIQSATMLFANPEVTFDWGDGTTQTGTGQGGSSPGLSFTFGPVAGCSSPWSFTATHTYNLDPPPFGGVESRKPVTYTVADGFGQSRTVRLQASVRFDSPPKITSGDATTFAVGTGGFFTFRASGAPTPSLAITSGSLPKFIGFHDNGDGTATLSGLPHITSGGTHPLTITATNSEGTDTQDFVLTVNVAPSFTNNASRALRAGEAGTVTFETSGFPAPAISIDSVDGPGSGTNLPSGLTFADNGDGTATLSGTPDAGSVGAYQLTMKATSNAGTAFQSFTLIVSTLPAFTSADTTSFRTGGSPTSFTITTSGSPAPAIGFTGDLPTGLAFHDHNDGTAVLFGSTSQTGTFRITLTATNAAGSGTQVLTINASVFGGPEITFSGPNWFSSDVLARFQESAVGSVTITRSDRTGSLALEGTPPSGISFVDNGDGTATLSGTPPAGSSGYYGLKVTGGGGLAFLSVAVYGPPSFTSASSAQFTVGTAGSFAITTSGAPVARFSVTGDLPDGLTFADSGLGRATIAGTPTAAAAGTATVVLSAENILGTATSDLSVEVRAAPAITSDASVGFGLGVDRSFDVTTSGFPKPALNVVGTLPPGIAFTDNGDGTGTLAGTPSDRTTTTYAFTIVASSSAGTATQSFELSVGPVPTFASLDATFTVGTAGSFTVSADGVPAPSIELAGNLPTGLTFADSGDGTATLSGTPAVGEGGLTTLQVKARNVYGSVTDELAIAVNEAPSFLGKKVGLTCAQVTPPDFGGAAALFSADSLGQWDLCATGYPAPAFSLDGALPQGLSFVDNHDGTATIAGVGAHGMHGTYPLTLTMRNAAGVTQQELTLDMVEPVASADPSATAFVAGQTNSYQLSAAGFPTPRFSFCPCGDPPPAWLTLEDHGNGRATLSGTPPPEAVGSEFMIQVVIENGFGNGGSADVFLTVAAIGFTAAGPPRGTLGRPYSYTFAATDRGATFALAPDEELPPGLTLSPSGVLSGTPTLVGRWRFRVVATAGGESATTGPIEFVAGAAPRQLEISKFRLIGPTGESDWFVELTNTTSVPIQLVGWKVRVPLAEADEIVPIDLGRGILAPDRSLVVAGPFSSLPPRLTVDLFGIPRLLEPAGFAVVAPDGTVTDRAGEVGAAADLREGTGVAVPEPADKVRQAAFFRRFSGGAFDDTDNNARDFEYLPLTTPKLATRASDGIRLGGRVNNTATLSGGNAATGALRFRLYGPDDASCSGEPVFTTTNAVSGDGSYTSSEYTPSKVGTYRWVAAYSGDQYNGEVSGACNDAGQSVVVAKATPRLSTRASAGIVVGGRVRDTARLSDGFAPTGRIIFRLYGHRDTRCAKAPIFASRTTVTGNGAHSSAWFTPKLPGTYRWTASYSGDANHDPVAGRCDDRGQRVAVSEARPVLTTKASRLVALGRRIRATAKLARSSAATGRIIFTLYGPKDARCSRAPVFTARRIVSGNGRYVSASFRPRKVGTYRWIASYSGDARNRSASTACLARGSSSSIRARR